MQGLFTLFEEEDFDDDFDKAFNEVTASGGVYNCIDCKKSYKTLGGLQRHNKARHTENNSEGKQLLLYTAVLTDLLRKAAGIVSKDECWSQDTRGSIQDSCCIVDGKLFEEISKLCETQPNLDLIYIVPIQNFLNII